MEAQIAMAFAARRAGQVIMDPARWRHILSLELGWMAPGLAKRYVEACVAAGILVTEGAELRLAFDPKGVEFPRGFRPDPEALPPPGEAAPAMAVPQTPGGGPADRAGTDALTASDIFAAWLPKVAAARGEDLGATMAAMEALQARSGGLLFAEAALLALGARAGLDVRDAAARALRDLQA